MNVKTAVASFFNRVPGVLAYVGTGGWRPGGTAEGMAPFNQVGSDAGVMVSPGGSLQLIAAWACVSLIASTVATLPLVYTDVDPATGKRVPQVNSPIHRMLTLSPNKDMTAIDFWEMMVASLCLWGNAYARLDRIVGRVVSMTPLRPEYMTVARNPNGDIEYRYQPGVYPAQVFTAKDILHIKGFGADGLVGFSPIAMARQALGRSIAADQASGKVFASGMSASGLIKYEKAFKSKEQRDEIRDSIAGFTGSSNTGKVMVLENGMEYQSIQMSSKDAQLLESRMFNVEEVCRIWRVPPQLIGHVLKSSSWASSIESTTIGFKAFCLRAYFRRIEQAVAKALSFTGTQQLKYNQDDLDCADSTALANLDGARVQNGLRFRNELRRRDGLDEIPGGDVLTVQSNLVPIDRLGDIVDAATRPPPAPAANPSQEPPK